MRRMFVLLAIAAACVVSTAALVLTPTSAPHRAKVSDPNFVCVSTPYFGVCIGPPTQQG